MLRSFVFESQSYSTVVPRAWSRTMASIKLRDDWRVLGTDGSISLFFFCDLEAHQEVCVGWAVLVVD